MKGKNMINEAPFTMVDALAIQERHLSQWEIVLKPDVVIAMRQEASRQNKALAKAKDANPYDVWRGTEIDCFVMNYAGKIYQSR